MFIGEKLYFFRHFHKATIKETLPKKHFVLSNGSDLAAKCIINDHGYHVTMYSNSIAAFFLSFYMHIKFLFVKVMVWPDQEKAFAVLTFNTTGSFVKTAVIFKNRYGTRKSLAKARIQAWLKKFKDSGSVKNCNKGNSGRHRSSQPEANVDHLQASVKTSPETSFRRRVVAENPQMSQ